MTCEECLSALATESLRQMTPDSPVMQHSATCPECARLTTTLRDREYETATVLNGLPPMSNPLTVADTALRIAQRRRVGRVAVMISGATLAATIGIVFATIVVPAMNEGDAVVRTARRTETIPLTCLSPQQAADIINPYIRGDGSIYWIPKSGISAITVRGTRDELIKSRDLLDEFEQDPNAACRVNATTPALGGADAEPDPDPNLDRAPNSLLGKPAVEPLLNMNVPRGTGPVVTPHRATPAPKKQ
jgi:glutaredoxin-related protein